jgi:TorA maturation chaperone TorD
MDDENLLWRAQTYALLASFLSSPPSQELLNHVIKIDVTEPTSPMGKQWLTLINAARMIKAEDIVDEYQTLFIGVTHGELIPYGSYYQTGFLMEEPLAILRTDLGQLGLERQEDVAEPEDHAAAMCDVMRLILIAEGTPVVTADVFFTRHLQPWLHRFFDDMSKNSNANFYKSLGLFGSKFMQLEQGLFA